MPFRNANSSLSISQIKTIRNAAKLKITKFIMAEYAFMAGDNKYNLRLSKIRAVAIENQNLEIQPNANTFAEGFGALVNDACNKYENRCVIFTITELN